MTECNLRPQGLSPEVAVALAQDKLGLKVTKDTYTRWVVKNWVAWTQWLLGIGVPATHMVRSRLSVDKGEREEFSLPGFACSTAALLALLCRWEVTLAGEEAKAAARDLRKAWVQHFFAGRAWVWPVPEDLQANWTGLRQVGALGSTGNRSRPEACIFVARLTARLAMPSQAAPKQIQALVAQPFRL